MDVKDMSLVEILDKNIDQIQLGKDLLAKFVAEKFAEIKAKVDAGEIDLIPGTELDNALVKSLVDAIGKALGL